MKKVFGISAPFLFMVILMAVCVASALILIALFKSGPIFREGIVGTMSVSIDGTTWVDYPNALTSTIADPLYARFTTTQAGYSGSVTVTWKLVEQVSGIEVETLTEYTTFTLTGNAGDVIYVTVDGLGPPGYDWGPSAGLPVEYYIQAEFYK